MWWMCLDVSQSGQPPSGNAAVPESVPKPQRAELNPPNRLLTALQILDVMDVLPFRLFPLTSVPLIYPHWSIGPSLSSTVILIVLLSSVASVAVCAWWGGGMRTFASAKPVIKVWRYMWNHYTAQLPGDADRGYSRSKSHRAPVITSTAPTQLASSSSEVRWVQIINPSPLMTYWWEHI